MRTFVALAALLPATADAFMVAPFAPAPLMQQLQRPHFLGLDDWFFDPFRSAVSGLDAGPTQVRDVTKPLQPVLAVDFVETENDYQIHADLPGVAKDQIQLDYDNGMFTISGERKAGYEKNTDTARYAERSFGKVSRSIRVPSSGDMLNAKASFDNGVLEVRIPKKNVCENCAMKIPIA